MNICVYWSMSEEKFVVHAAYCSCPVHDGNLLLPSTKVAHYLDVARELKDKAEEEITVGEILADTRFARCARELAPLPWKSW